MSWGILGCPGVIRLSVFAFNFVLKKFVEVDVNTKLIKIKLKFFPCIVFIGVWNCFSLL